MKEEIKDDTERGKGLPRSGTGRAGIVEMAALPIVACRHSKSALYETILVGLKQEATAFPTTRVNPKDIVLSQ